MAVALKMERGAKTLDELLAEADRPEFRRRIQSVLKGRTGTQYLKDLRRELEKKYSAEELFEYYTRP